MPAKRALWRRLGGSVMTIDIGVAAAGANSGVSSDGAWNSGGGGGSEGAIGCSKGFSGVWT